MENEKSHIFDRFAINLKYLNQKHERMTPKITERKFNYFKSKVELFKIFNLETTGPIPAKFKYIILTNYTLSFPSLTNEICNYAPSICAIYHILEILKTNLEDVIQFYKVVIKGNINIWNFTAFKRSLKVGWAIMDLTHLLN